MNQLNDLLNKGILVQAALAIIVLITVCTLALEGKVIDDTLKTVLSLILGFYFGSHMSQIVENGNSSKT